MEKKAVFSMTEGSPSRLLLKFTIPMLIGNLFQQFYNMVDSIVVGRFVGSNALAAVGNRVFEFFVFCYEFWHFSGCRCRGIEVFWRRPHGHGRKKYY